MVVDNIYLYASERKEMVTCILIRISKFKLRNGT